MQRTAAPPAPSDAAAPTADAPAPRSASPGEAARALDGLLSLLRVAPWIYDPRKNTVTWQRIFSESPGMVRPQTTERLADVVARYSEDDRQGLLKHYETALRDGYSGPVRFAVHNRAGDRTFIESAAIRVEPEPGQPLVRGVFRNCADDVVKDQTLHDAMALLGQLTAISPSAIILLDGSGTIRSVNPEFLRCFGVADEKALIGRSVRTVGNAIGKTIVATLTMLLDNDKEIVRAQQRFLRPDHSSVTLDYRSQRFGSGSGRGLMFAAESANSDTVNMDLLFNRLPTPMIAVDLGNNIIAAANTAAQRVFGLRGDHVGHEAITQILMKAEDIQHLKSIIAADGLEAGYVCPVRSMLGGGLNYRVKASTFTDAGRTFLALEFHPTVSRRAAAQKAGTNRKGLLTRVVEHLDF